MEAFRFLRDQFLTDSDTWGLDPVTDTSTVLVLLQVYKGQKYFSKWQVTSGVKSFVWSKSLMTRYSARTHISELSQGLKYRCIRIVLKTTPEGKLKSRPGRPVDENRAPYDPWLQILTTGSFRLSMVTDYRISVTILPLTGIREARKLKWSWNL